MIIANIMGFGNPIEMGIVALVVMVLFGASKVGQFGKSLGEGLKEFKKAARDEPDSTPESAQVLTVAATEEKPAETVGSSTPSTKE